MEVVSVQKLEPVHVLIQNPTQPLRVREKHIIVDFIGADIYIPQIGRRFAATDKQAVVPLRKIHMGKLLMIHNGNKVHVLLFQIFFPLVQGVFAVTGTAGIGVVMQVAMISHAAAVQTFQLRNIRFRSCHVDLRLCFLCSRWRGLSATLRTTCTQIEQCHHDHNQRKYSFHKYLLLI